MNYICSSISDLTSIQRSWALWELWPRATITADAAALLPLLLHHALSGGASTADIACVAPL